MAWWTDVLFIKEKAVSPIDPKGGLFISYYQSIKLYFQKKFVDILYVIFSLFTYLYLAISIVTFFFRDNVPTFFPFLIEVLSEPYLGALGIYIVIREIGRRQNRHMARTEMFVPLWSLFFITASVVFYLSPAFYAVTLYKTIVTNAVAAIIIRIGVFLRSVL